jgi:transcriptional regulator with XRE-family HTH domain
MTPVSLGARVGFGQELSRLRRATGVTRETLADAIGVSKGYLALLEQGHRRPSGSVVDRAANALGLDSIDASRLRVRAVLDRFNDEVAGLASSDLHIIEGVADAILLFAEDSDVASDLGETLTIGVDRELRLKASSHVGHVLRRVAERWRETEFLTMQDYFHSITSAMNTRKLAIVNAINTIDPRRWIDDQREVRYLEANSRAIERGTRIRRLFIVDSTVGSQALARVAQVHQDAGVSEVRWLSQSIVSELADLPEDAVLFDGETAVELYIGHVDPEDSIRVEFGERVVSAGEIRRFNQYFDVLYNNARPEPRH